jgi:hypothetical protein
MTVDMVSRARYPLEKLGTGGGFLLDLCGSRGWENVVRFSGEAYI